MIDCVICKRHQRKLSWKLRTITIIGWISQAWHGTGARIWMREYNKGYMDGFKHGVFEERSRVSQEQLAWKIVGKPSGKLLGQHRKDTNQ